MSSFCSGDHIENLQRCDVVILVQDHVTDKLLMGMKH